MDSVELLSPAKINLTLEVSARRPDGFHDIDSVVQVIDITDELRVVRAESGLVEVEADAADVPNGPENLVYRACAAFFERTRVRGGARCLLRKRIPAQAGLGGGSGNAATALVALDNLYETGLPREELAAIAATIGSDAALFIYGGTLRMRGRGELITALPNAPTLDVVVVKPDVGISTAWAYGKLDARVWLRAGGTSELAQRAVERGDREALLGCLTNDFDAVATEEFVEVRRVKMALAAVGASHVMLCGSGSAVFGVFADGELAGEAAERLRKDGMRAFVARSAGSDIWR